MHQQTDSVATQKVRGQEGDKARMQKDLEKEGNATRNRYNDVG